MPNFRLLARDPEAAFRHEPFRCFRVWIGDEVNFGVMELTMDVSQRITRGGGELLEIGRPAELGQDILQPPSPDNLSLADRVFFHGPSIARSPKFIRLLLHL